MSGIVPPYPPFPPFPPFPSFAPYTPFPAFPAAPPRASCYPPRAADNQTPAENQPLAGAASAAPPGSTLPPGPAPGLVGSRSPFPVSATSLAADPSGLHQGTGTHQRSLSVVVPGSVAPAGQLHFSTANATVTALLFQLATSSSPNWFAVAVPPGVTDFGHVHVFFHPIPAQGGYLDSDYPHKAETGYVNAGRPWSNLFYLIERLGYQSAASAQPMVVVMPFLTSAATNTGIFAPNWSAVLSDILTDSRSAVGVPAATPVDVSRMVVSSHSVGIVYSAAFRQLAPGLSAVLTDVWDFDGHASSSAALSDALVSTAKYRAIKYDQGGGTASFHVPGPRWTGLPVPSVFPPYINESDVHHMIRDFMAIHAATLL
jgi:hypothetical protein